MKINLSGVLVVFLLSFSSYGQLITTVAGTGSGTFGGDGSPATAAGVTLPIGGCFDRAGNYYFVDQLANRVRKIDNAGIITTVAGNGTAGFSMDSIAATASQLNLPYCVQTDTADNLYIADQLNHRIRKVDAATGIISTIAGTGTAGSTGESGPATAAEITGPVSLALDRMGNIYIAMNDNRIRKVNAAGIITTIAGTGVAGYSGDGFPAISALLNMPGGLAVDDTGNLYIAELVSSSNRVRKINSAGIINTVVGNGSATFTTDSVAATDAAIVPCALAIDNANNLFIADNHNQRVYRVDAGTGILRSIAGNGTAGDTGDGSPATAASLYNPTGVALDMCGNVYVPTVGSPSVTGTGRRIRKVFLNTTHPPVSVAVSITPGDTVCSGMLATVTATVTGMGTPVSYQWIRNVTPVFAATNSVFTSAALANNDSIVCVYKYRENCSGDTLSVHGGFIIHVIPANLPTISITATSPVVFGSTVTVNATVSGAGSGYYIKWADNSVPFAVTTVPTISFVKLAGIDTITATVFSTSAIGCYDSASAVPQMVTGIPVGVSTIAVPDWNVNIYPNPAHTFISISAANGLSAGCEATISNMLGQVLVRKEISLFPQQMDIAALPSGIYAVTVSDADGRRVVTKVIKE